MRFFGWSVRRSVGLLVGQPPDIRRFEVKKLGVGHRLCGTTPWIDGTSDDDHDRKEKEEEEEERRGVE